MADYEAKASVEIDADSGRVWEALTSHQAIKQYMFGTTVESDWRVGSPITWSGEWQGKAYQDKGEILRFEPVRCLSYSHYSPLSGARDEPDSYHTVTIELAADDGRTRVSLAQNKNATEEERDHSQENWQMMLGGLKKYLEE